MAIFLASKSVASVPPGVTAYLAALVLCLSLHPAMAGMMSRWRQYVYHDNHDDQQTREERECVSADLGLAAVVHGARGDV